jgi:hypothetical protein
MFQGWRLKLRAAEEAYRGGRFQEAGQLLNDSDLRAFLPAKQLLAKVADQLAHRGRNQLSRGESRAGWQDLEMAMHWGANDEVVGTAREEFVRHVLEEAEALIAAGEPTASLERLRELDKRHAANAEVRTLKQVAQKVEVADRLARSGKFAEAEQLLAGAVALRPGSGALTAARQACLARGAECRKQVEDLHAALSGEQWTKVLSTSEAILALAPAHEQAKDARRRAWLAVGIGVANAPAPPRRPNPTAFAEIRNHRELPMASVQESSADSSLPSADERFVLWVDGVGGYLVCTAETITLGQPGPGADADVAILADLSRHHARIRRGGEGYLLEPIREVSVNGRQISAPTTLGDGALIDLGGGVQLRFRRPHALSATARLEFLSRHRTVPAVDAVLLMSESCVLGPGPNSHVVCRDWKQDVVLSRHDGQLYCRTKGRLEVNGVCCEGRSPIERNAQIAGDEFSLSLEQV